LSTCAVTNICTFIGENLGPATILNNATGCNSRPEVQNECTILSVDELAIDHIKFYPNPATDQFTIYDPNNLVQKSEIINSQGKVLNIIDRDLSDISISSLSPGIYFVRVYDKTGGLLKTGKLIIR